MNSARCPLHQTEPQKQIFSQFSVQKIGLFLKKVWYKFSLCENFQWRSSKAFTGLSNHAQRVGGERPFLPEILGQSDPPLQKRQLSIDIRSQRLNHST